VALKSACKLFHRPVTCITNNPSLSFWRSWLHDIGDASLSPFRIR